MSDLSSLPGNASNASASSPANQKAKAKRRPKAMIPSDLVIMDIPDAVAPVVVLRTRLYFVFVCLYLFRKVFFIYTIITVVLKQRILNFNYVARRSRFTFKTFL